MKQGKGKTIPSLCDFILFSFVMALMIQVVHPLLPCSSKADCRRNACIQNFCRPPSPLSGPCDVNQNEDCYGSNVCILQQCFPLSDNGEPCDQVDDCIGDPGTTECREGTCASISCQTNDDCDPGFVCISNGCSDRSDAGENCDEGQDEECVDGLVCRSETCFSPWELQPDDMPFSVSLGVSGTINDLIFVGGGNEPADQGFKIRQFKPNEDPQWPSSPTYEDSPLFLYFSSSVVVNNKLYATGIVFGDSEFAISSFDPFLEQNQWNQLAVLLESRQFSCMAAIGQMIFLFGGVNNLSQVTDSIFVYDIELNTWNELSLSLPTSLLACAAAEAQGSIYIFGGSNDGQSGTTAILRFFPNGQDYQIESLDSVLVIPRLGHTATTVNGKIIIAGGGDEQTTWSSAELFDPSTQNISSLPDMNVARSTHQAAALGNTLFVFSGNDVNRTPLISAEKFVLPSFTP